METGAGIWLVIRSAGSQIRLLNKHQMGCNIVAGLESMTIRLEKRKLKSEIVKIELCMVNILLSMSYYCCQGVI